MMGEVALVMGDTGNGLGGRLEAEINAFNVTATGDADGGVLSIAARGDGGQVRGGLFGWTWAAAASLSLCGSAAEVGWVEGWRGGGSSR
jgi:hypothetical protein